MSSSTRQSTELSHQVCTTCTVAEARQICAKVFPELASLSEIDDGQFLAIVVHQGVEAFVVETPRLPDDLPDLDSDQISPQIIRLVPATLCREHGILPLDWRDGQLYVAADKWDESFVDMLRFMLCGQPKIRLVIRPRESIARALEKYHGPGATG